MSDQSDEEAYLITYVIKWNVLFPRAMSQAAVLARTVGECREKSNTPLPGAFQV